MQPKSDPFPLFLGVKFAYNNQKLLLLSTFLCLLSGTTSGKSNDQSAKTKMLDLYLKISNLIQFEQKKIFSQKGIRFPLNNSKLLLLFTFLSLLSETPSKKSNDQTVKNFKMLVLGPKMSHLPHFGQNKVFSPKRVSSLFSVNWHYIYMQLIIYFL